MLARSRELVLQISARRKKQKKPLSLQGPQTVPSAPTLKPRPFVCVDSAGTPIRGAFDKLKNGKKPVACILEYISNPSANDPGSTLVPNNRSYHLYREIPTNQHALIPGALMFLPLEHRIKPRLTPAEERTVIQTSKRDTYRHLTADAAKFKAKFSHLNVTTSNLRSFIEEVCNLFFLRASTTYFESREDNYTWVMVLYLDAVVPAHQIPTGFNKQCLKCVFSEYFIVTQDAKSTKFPKTLQQQNQTGNSVWQKYSPIKQNRIQEEAEICKIDPLLFLKRETWDLFFPGAYDQKTGKVSQNISIERLNLALLYQQGARFKGLPILSTIVPYDLQTGSNQVHHQLLQDAWGVADFDRRLSGNFQVAPVVSI